MTGPVWRGGDSPYHEYLIYDDFGQLIGQEAPEKEPEDPKTSLRDFERMLHPSSTLPTCFSIYETREPDSMDIVVAKHPVCVYGVTEEQALRDGLRDLLRDLAQPVVKIADLPPLLDGLAFDGDDGRTKENLLRPLSKEYMSLDTVEMVLGEKICKQLNNLIPIKYKVEKKTIPELQRLIRLTEEEAGYRLDLFREEKDYILEKSELFQLYPILKARTDEENAGLRIEMLKLALENYFSILQAVNQGTDAMVTQIRKLKESMTEDLWRKMVADLESKVTQVEKEQFYNELPIALQLTDPDKLVFLDLMKLIDFDLLEPIDILFPPLAPLDWNNEDLLYSLERGALQTLENICCELRLRIRFRKGGKVIYLGSIREPDKSVLKKSPQPDFVVVDGPEPPLVVLKPRSGPAPRSPTSDVIVLDDDDEKE